MSDLTLWSDHNTYECELDSVAYNLGEDIQCLKEEITRLRARLAETQKREQELLSERKGEGVRTRRAIAEAKKKWLAEAEGQECVVMLAVNTETGEVDYSYLQYDMRSEQETKTETMALVDGWEYRKFKVVPLAHPAPAKVPDILTPADATEYIFRNQTKATSDEVRCIVEGWNACREAMLEAQGGY